MKTELTIGGKEALIYYLGHDIEITREANLRIQGKAKPSSKLRLLCGREGYTSIRITD